MRVSGFGRGCSSTHIGFGWKGGEQLAETLDGAGKPPGLKSLRGNRKRNRSLTSRWALDGSAFPLPSLPLAWKTTRGNRFPLPT
jgi:hypothetical protein